MAPFLRKQHITLACFFVCLFLGVGIYFNHSENEQRDPIKNEELLKEVENFSKISTLKFKNKNLVYLKVSDEYVTNIYPLFLKTLSTKEKDCLGIDKNDIGAHITLLKNKRTLSLDKNLENTLFPFKTKNFYKITLNSTLKQDRNNKKKKVLINETWYCLEVDSPQAAEVIKKNDPSLYEKIEKKDYVLHISFAVAKKYADTGRCYLPGKEK